MGAGRGATCDVVATQASERKACDPQLAARDRWARGEQLEASTREMRAKDRSEETRFYTGIRRKWSRSHAMARNRRAFEAPTHRKPAKPQVALFDQPRGSRAACHSDRPQPLSTNSDAKTNSREEGSNRNVPNSTLCPAGRKKAIDTSSPQRAKPTTPPHDATLRELSAHRTSPPVQTGEGAKPAPRCPDLPSWPAPIPRPDAAAGAPPAAAASIAPTPPLQLQPSFSAPTPQPQAPRCHHRRRHRVRKLKRLARS